MKETFAVLYKKESRLTRNENENENFSSERSFRRADDLPHHHHHHHLTMAGARCTEM